MRNTFFPDCCRRTIVSAKADVKKALLSWAQKGVRDDSGHIGPLSYESATLQPREDGDQSESVSMKFAVTYRESYGDPTSTTR